MSPDQLRSTKDVDGRADIWSLGVVLFELVSGHTPFTATDITPLIAQILHEPHQRLTDLRTDATPELEAIVDKCLAKDAAKRYQSPAELAVALLPFAPKRSRALVERANDIVRSAGGSVAELDSIPPPPPAPPAPASSASSVAAVAPSQAPPDKPGAIVWIIAGLVLLVGIGAGVAALMSGGKPPSIATGSATGVASATGWASVPSETTTSTPVAIPADTATAQSTAQHPTTFVARPTGPRPAAPPTSVGKPPTVKPPESDIRMER
jgi:serine/threonine-protein kinase